MHVSVLALRNVYVCVYIYRERVIFPTRIWSNHISLAYFGICSMLLRRSITNPEKMIFCGGVHVKAGFIRGDCNPSGGFPYFVAPFFAVRSLFPSYNDGGTHPKKKGIAFQAAFGIGSTLLGEMMDINIIQGHHYIYYIYNITLIYLV